MCNHDGIKTVQSEVLLNLVLIYISCHCGMTRYELKTHKGEKIYSSEWSKHSDEI